MTEFAPSSTSASSRSPTGYWERAEFPRELVAPYAALHVAGGSITDYGCPGMSALTEGLVTLELARGDGSFSTFNSVHSGLAMSAIALLGYDDAEGALATRPGACTSSALSPSPSPTTAPTWSGSQPPPAATATYWVLNGAKRWIGNGTIADLVVVWARDEDGHGDVGGFVVDRTEDNPAGYHASVITGKTSNRALWQADIRLEDVRVPAENRLAGSRTFADTSRCLTKSRQAIAWEGARPRDRRI